MMIHLEDLTERVTLGCDLGNHLQVLFTNRLPQEHLTAKMFKQDPAVRQKSVDRFPVKPAALPSQRQRQIIVQQGDDRQDSILHQSVDQTMVKHQTLLADPAASFGKNP